jgi:hypothetical protein
MNGAPAAGHMCCLLLLLPAGDLFFTDWTDMPLETRMKNWDRRFKLLTAYPQVC